MRERINEVVQDIINEPCSIGEEQLPYDFGEKHDKQPWTLAADEIEEDITWWQRLRNRLKGGT